MKTVRIDDIEGLPVLGTLSWKPVRRPLGITAFGINAYTAGKAGDEVVEEHTEQTEEEAYVVIRGHATFNGCRCSQRDRSHLLVAEDEHSGRREPVAKDVKLDDAVASKVEREVALRVGRRRRQQLRVEIMQTRRQRRRRRTRLDARIRHRRAVGTDHRSRNGALEDRRPRLSSIKRERES